MTTTDLSLQTLCPLCSTPIARHRFVMQGWLEDAYCSDGRVQCGGSLQAEHTRQLQALKEKKAVRDAAIVEAFDAFVAKYGTQGASLLVEKASRSEREEAPALKKLAEDLSALLSAEPAP